MTALRDAIAGIMLGALVVAIATVAFLYIGGVL